MDSIRDSLTLLKLLALSCPLILSGCNKADVQTSGAKFQTEITILEPAYAMRRAKGDAPWYGNLQVLLDEKPVDDKDLQAKIEAGRDDVKKGVEELLQEIGDTIEAQRKGNDKWSIVSATCGRGKKLNEVHFEAEVGITKLFERRATIAFDNVRLELCVAKLCRESEIQDSQPRGHNPSISWEKHAISAFEAISILLNTSGFDAKFIDTSYKVTFKAQDFASRKEFIDAVKEAVLAKGKTLNTVRPALAVAPKVKPEPPKDEAEKKSGVAAKTGTGAGVATGTKPAADQKPPADVKAPAPPPDADH